MLKRRAAHSSAPAALRGPPLRLTFIAALRAPGVLPPRGLVGKLLSGGLPEDQMRALSAAFRAAFGDSHRLVTVGSADEYLVKTGIAGGRPTTVINLSEKPVVRAILKNAMGVAAQEYALLHDNLHLDYAPIRSLGESADRWVGMPDMAPQMLTTHAVSLIHYTSAMSQHEHAAEFARYEHAKYVHLKGGRGPALRGVVLLSRAYVEAASDRYGAGIDAARLTAGMDLDGADQKILAASRDMLDDAHGQRLRGPRIDARRTTKALGASLRRQRKLFMAE